MTTPALGLAGIGKAFPEVVALDDVSLEVGAGEIRALMGENGAGKSTLLKILAGEYAPDAGNIRIDGELARFSGPRASAAAGIAVIHQELQLAPDMSVADNLLLGDYPNFGPFLDRGAMHRRARQVLSQLGEDIPLHTKVKDLPIGRRQMIEIGKALLRGARIIAFDEPTSSLSARETATLMRIIRDLKDEGRAILYVSHRMEEVFELCDSVTVLRAGRLVSTHADIAAVSRDAIISEMAGRRIEDIYGYRARGLSEARLTVDALFGPGLSAPVSFEARRGEILGFFGLIGAGRSELFMLLYGARAYERGKVRLGGRPLRAGALRSTIAAGVALAPGDRKDEGIIPLASVRDNISLAVRNILGKAKLFLDARGERQRAVTLIASLHIKTPSDAVPINTLSGGNQQKVILARWLAAESELLLLDEPTRGIDVGSRSEIYSLLYDLAERGKTLLIASSDMPELQGICDRIIVMREGEISGVVPRGEAHADTLLRLALPDIA